MVKFKIFFGYAGDGQADEEANNWLEKHPNIEVLDFKYQHHTSHRCHSICIMYKEK